MHVTRSKIGISDPVFHILLLFILPKSILARDGLVAVMGTMTDLGNKVSIYPMETWQLLYACVQSL